MAKTQYNKDMGRLYYMAATAIEHFDDMINEYEKLLDKNEDRPEVEEMIEMLDEVTEMWEDRKDGLRAATADLATKVSWYVT